MENCPYALFYICLCMTRRWNTIYYLVTRACRNWMWWLWLPQRAGRVTKGSFWFGGAAWHFQNPPHSYTWALKIGTHSYTSHSKLPPIHILVWHIEQLIGKINKPSYTNSYKKMPSWLHTTIRFMCSWLRKYLLVVPQLKITDRLRYKYEEH